MYLAQKIWMRFLSSDALLENALSTLEVRRQGGSEGQGLTTNNEIEGWVLLEVET
jgi:hypothetical protein